MVRRPTEHQVRATQVPVGVIVVSAGAGTGKTTVLSETVARKMVAEKGVDIRDLLVITFTRKAAAEMADRIRGRLRELADEKDDPEEKTRLLQAADNVEDASIETLDAFAQRLLREHAAYADLDPDFDVLSPDRNLELGLAVARECLERWVDDPPHERWSDAIRSVSAYDWPGVLHRLHEYALTRGLPSYGLFAAGKSAADVEDVDALLERRAEELAERFQTVKGEVRSRVDSLRGLLIETCGDCTQKGTLSSAAQKAAEILPDLDPLEEWLAQETLDWEDPIIDTVKAWTLGGGKVKSVVQDCRDEIKRLRNQLGLNLDKDKDLRDDSDSLKSVFVELHASAFRPALAKALLDYHDAFRDARRRMSAISFADGLVEAIRLLSESADIRDFCNRKYRYVVVDEYQDINPLQQQLIFMLCRRSVPFASCDRSPSVPFASCDRSPSVPFASCDRSSSEENPDLPGNLYLVGDERQSIYGFRDADFTLLRDLRRRMEEFADREGIGSRILHENFRARPELLDFVNHVFRKVWGQGTDEDVQHTDLKALFEPYLAEGRSDAPRIELHLVVASKAEAGRRREAAVIARRLAEIVRDDRPEIIHRGPGDEYFRSPIQWRDCAILMRRKAPFGLYEEALTSLGIPYVTESGGGFWVSPEVADVAALLYCLSPAPDNLDAAVLLRSPWVGISDDALLEIAVTTGRGDWLESIGATQGSPLRSDDDRRRIQDFLAWFEPLKKGFAGRVPVDRLVEEALEQSGYIERVLAQERGRQARANIEKLLGLLRDERALHNPAIAADYMQWLRSAESTEPQASVAPSGREGAVTLATVHMAKGREWPLVVVADLGSKAGYSPRGEVLWDEDHGLAFKWLDPSTGEALSPASFDAAARSSRTRDESETKRVLYVALTRAREYLILSSHIKEKTSKKESGWSHAKGSWLAQLRDALSDDAQAFVGTPDDVRERESVLTYMIPEPADPERSDSDPSESEMNEVLVKRFFHDSAAPLPPTIRRASPPGLLEELRTALGSLPELPARTASRYLLTATEVATFEKCPRMYAYRALWHVPQRIGIDRFTGHIAAPPSVDDDTPSDADEIHGEAFELPPSEWGTLAHKLMERVLSEPVPSSEVIRDAADEIIEQAGLDVGQYAGRLADLVSNALTLPIFERIRACEEVSRELRLLGPIGDTGDIVLGTIDLVAECGGDVIVVDYKSGKIDPNEAKSRAAEYELQLALYTHLVSAHKRVKPAQIECHVVFLDPATDVRLEMTGGILQPRAQDALGTADRLSPLRNAIETVRRLGEASVRNDFPGNPSAETCRRCDCRAICSLAPPQH